MHNGVIKTLTLNTATGTHCAIESAVVAIFLSETKQGGMVSTFSISLSD